MYRRSRALAHLPGPKPKNWFMGYMEMVYSQQPHRLNTALSERLGPIWKFRILCFHVSLPLPSAIPVMVSAIS